MTLQTKRILLIAAVALLAGLAPPGAQQTENEDGIRHVLILNSYHKEFKWTDSQVDGARKVLSEAVENLELYVEYMDTKRIYTEDYIEHLAQTYLIKYGDIQLDAIITTDDNALRLVLEHHEDIFQGAPVSFCGINDYPSFSLDGKEQFTGLVEVLDVEATLDLALRLHPKTRKVFVVVDNTPTGMGQRKEVGVAAQQFGDLEFEYLKGEDYSTDELIEKLGNLPEDGIVLLTVWLRDKNNDYAATDKVGELISAESSVPVYGIIDMYLGHGIVGGKLLNSESHGRMAAEMSVRIFNGEKPSDIPVLVESFNPYMFDETQLRRWGIELSDFPEGSVVINRYFSIYETHRTQIWSVAGIFALLLLVIAFLITSIMRRRQAEEALRKRESKYRTFFENSVDAMLIIRDYKFVDCNAATVAMLKHESKEDLLNTHPSELSPEFQPDGKRSYDKAVEMMEIALANGAHRFEWDHKRRNGEVFPVEVSLTAIPQDEETVLHTVWLDITERKRTEEALAEERLFLSFLINHIPNQIFWKKRNLVYWGCNQAFADVTGIQNPEAVVGKTDYDFHRDSTHADSYRELDAKIMETDEPLMNFEEKYHDADGREGIVLTSKIPIHDSSGTVVGLLGTCIDITDLRRNEKERLSLERQVQHAQKLESLGVLAGGIAHDFNNLLMTILGNADLVLDELSPHAPARENIKEIEKASKRAAELAKQMLAYSGKGRFVIEAINLNEFVEEMAHLLEVSISKKAVLKYNFTDNLPTIDGDATQIRQIIMNLITNASEAIGDKNGVIALSTGAMDCDRAYLDDVNEILRANLDEPLPEGVYTYLEVADTGCGMDAETIEKVFDPFFTTKFTGRGLGMSAVLGIVRGHEGAIRICSEVGKGTTFMVLFPSKERGDSGSAVQRKDEADEKDWRGSGLVLIADDEETVCAVGKQMLERLGFSAMTAPDGREALDVFREHSDEIVCVLLDLTMPHMGGEETFREMRRIRTGVKVILCSGYNMEDATQRFAGKGLAGFIQKPYDMATLRAKMREVLES